MTFLVDTNVISELRKGDRTDPGVALWRTANRNADLYLSVLVLGEIRKGIEAARVRDLVKSEALARWLEVVEVAFADRILVVDRAIADVWGRMSAKRTVPAVDGLLAATAFVHRLTLVTRNAADVSDLGVRVLNPFDRPRQ